MVDFAVSVRKWVDKAKDRSNEAFRATATDALARVKELTPVVTGYLRANFVDSMDPQAVRDPSMAPTEGLAIAKARIGDVVFIVNPVIYARRVEYGFIGEDGLGRSFSQRGRGMVQQVVVELPEIAAQAVRRINREG